MGRERENGDSGDRRVSENFLCVQTRVSVHVCMHACVCVCICAHVCVESREMERLLEREVGQKISLGQGHLHQACVLAEMSQGRGED